MSTPSIERNWSGNYQYRAHAVHHPQSLDELRRLVAQAPSVQALGSRHSFTSIGDADELIALDRLGDQITVDRDTGTVSAPAAMTYAELAASLNHEAMALPNLASLPHISVGGAVATATHGSGERLGNLATSVTGIELVTSAGDVLTARRGDERFDGLVVGLGAAGIVTRLQLAVEPYYEMSQLVYEGLEWEALYEHFDEIYAAGDSVSVFHRLGGRAGQVWVKRRAPVRDAPGDLFGAVAAGGPRNPVLGADPINCTSQLGRAGPWSERLPHFRSGFTPSSGEEIQSEVFVARHDAIAAIQAVRALGEQLRPLLLVGELRAIAADALWLSPQYERDTVALHFTWRREQAAVEAAVQQIEAALTPFAARPHWGKVTSLRAAQIGPLYERLDDFRRLRDELDPRGAFVNDWLRDYVLGGAEASCKQGWHTGCSPRGRSSVG
ncbi:MAG: D-arabinono-1,4-lactone oxidase [Solirubrobacteraceae bacterium]